MGFWDNGRLTRTLNPTGWPPIPLNFTILLNALYIAATILVSYGAVAGRISFGQAYGLAFFEVFFATAAFCIMQVRVKNTLIDDPPRRPRALYSHWRARPGVARVRAWGPRPVAPRVVGCAQTRRTAAPTPAHAHPPSRDAGAARQRRWWHDVHSLLRRQ